MFRMVITAFAALSVAGCAAVSPVYQSSVSSYVAPEYQPGSTYAIVPTAEQKDDLAFAEVQTLLARGLEGAGLASGKDWPSTKVAIFVRYGIGEPKTETNTYSSPIIGQNGTRTVGSTTTFDAMGNLHTENVTEPTYGVVGTRSNTVTTTSYDRYLTLTGYDAAAYRQTKQTHQLWMVQVRSTGSSDDLRSVIPYMINAAMPYVGKSSGRAVVVRTPQNDPAVAYIRTGAPAPSAALAAAASK